MQQVFESINKVFSFVGPLSDFLWDFPTNFEWYRNIPLLGNFSFAIILLLGSGMYFSFRLGFIQVRGFKKGIQIMTAKRSVETGISPMAAFLLSSAMRVGPGNILGVTGAIAVGGPGAIFWMWVSAFFGMAVAYMEAVLAQIFKEKKDDEFVGGLPFYGRKLLGNKVWIGVFLSILYILYALCCLPAQGFNVVSSVGRMAEIITGTSIATDSAFYYVVGALTIVVTAIIAFGGIKKVSKWTDKMVPVMAVLYVVTVLVLIVLNLGTVPYFFKAVFAGAFHPDAVFGGLFGTLEMEPLVCVLYGGVLCGVGLGMVFVCGTSTGGSDILVRLLKLRYRNVPIGQISMCFDAIVVALTGLVFQDVTKALYTGITVFLTSQVIDAVVYRFDYSKVALIISKEHEQIAKQIGLKLDRGATFLHAEGTFSHMQTKVVLTAVKKQQLAELKELVTRIDPNAFIIVQEAHQVLGDGFSRYTKESL